MSRQKEDQCYRGHKMAGDNVYEYQRGGYTLRQCKACQQIRRDQWTAQNRELRKRFLKVLEATGKSLPNEADML